MGSISWLSTMCRPDISYAVQKVAQFADKPTGNAVTAAKRILRYLSGTRERGVEYTPENEKAFNQNYFLRNKLYVCESGWADFECRAGASGL